MTDYDHIIEKENADDRTFPLPEKFQGEDCVVRQKGGTTTHQGRTMRWEASSQNDHLEVNQEEGWFEVEVKIFGEESDLIKVETPEGYFEDDCEICGETFLRKEFNDVRFNDSFEDSDYICDECKEEGEEECETNTKQKKLNN